jgi:hypothetical protein
MGGQFYGNAVLVRESERFYTISIYEYRDVTNVTLFCLLITFLSAMIVNNVASNMRSNRTVIL